MRNESVNRPQKIANTTDRISPTDMPAPGSFLRRSDT